jgi:hypothetical protein
MVACEKHGPPMTLVSMRRNGVHAVIIAGPLGGLRCSVPSGGAEGNMAEGLISDPETDEIVAIIRGGEVYRFHNDIEGPKIAIVVGTCLYGLNGNLVGNLVGQLHGQHVIDPSTQSMPVAFRELLEDKS